MKYTFIKANREKYKTARLLSALNVSPSGYYDWLNRPVSKRVKDNRTLTAKILRFHNESNGIYGSPRIHQDLVESGERVGLNRVDRLMQSSQVQSKVAKKFVITTDSKNTLEPAPDRLQRQFRVPDANMAWVSDTTFIRTRQGWLYLAVMIDLFSRSVIG